MEDLLRSTMLPEVVDMKTLKNREFAQVQYWVGSRHGKGRGKEWRVCSLLSLRQPRKLWKQDLTKEHYGVDKYFRKSVSSKNKHLTKHLTSNNFKRDL